MDQDQRVGRERLPAIERLLHERDAAPLVERYGRGPVVAALRDAVASARDALGSGRKAETEPGALITETARRLSARHRPSPRPVLNLTGTMLHTNLGRSPLPDAAVAAVAAAARGPVALEYDLETGRRGERDRDVERWLTRLTGAEAATLVNNNAAAVLLILAALAARREVIVSRGELVEIGGSFRMPDVMKAAGCRLREVGTTNRTHERDYVEAIGPRTALLMRVHASNYRIEGFTAAVPDADLASVARRHDLPFVVDLGSGSLVDLRAYGLPHEPTVGEALGAGADLVCFSGDKLLGGPQAGLIVGRRDLVERIRRHPLKRALRCDKLTLAALAAVLPLHADPETLPARLPALALLTRPREAIADLARDLAPVLDARLPGVVVESVACMSQIGSGAQPTALLPSAGLRLSPARGGPSARRLAAALRRLSVPVLGRIEDGAVWLDLRGLADAADLLDRVDELAALLKGAEP